MHRMTPPPAAVANSCAPSANALGAAAATPGAVDAPDLGMADALSRFQGAHPHGIWQALATSGLAQWPQPGAGRTLQRWRALAAVAGHDLSLAKLVEGHTDALAILRELGQAPEAPERQRWSTWAAEQPGSRVVAQHADARVPEGAVRLTGTKAWCSGAAVATHALLTAWLPDGSGPQLVSVALDQPGVQMSTHSWRAVGMADSASADVQFDQALATLVGGPGDYLSRPGFWHGGAGIAACWWGGARALGEALRSALEQMPAPARSPFRQAALGRVDGALQGNAALLREAADWIDAHPDHDASLIALRLRQAAELCARRVLDEVGRALGATPFCRDAHFARLSADLPVFIRQSHAERDDAAVGERVLAQADAPWTL